MEWIIYLASPDPETGKTIFNFKLKQAFDLFDTDKDGFIDLEDLSSLLKDSLGELTKGKSGTTKKVVEKLTNALAVEIMNTLDTSDNNGKLDWQEFKKYMWYAKDKEDKLKEFVDYQS
jgi:Ca2+-binding EF-hand superfamily protein